MTNKLKCPFCQQELHKDPDGYYSCYTDNCSIMSAGGNGASGTESLWQALIQAKQDLEIAVGALRNIGASNNRVTNLAMQKIAHKTLNQIEQKD